VSFSLAADRPLQPGDEGVHAGARSCQVNGYGDQDGADEDHRESPVVEARAATRRANLGPTGYRGPPAPTDRGVGVVRSA
jgi:hypothetical protein